MPRRAEIQVRPVEPDPVYSSPLVTQVINKVMSNGKKSTAEAIVYSALERISEKTGKPPVEVLEQAVKTVTPVLRWLVDYARQRREKGMVDKLSNEILDALNQQGGAFKRKDDVYRMAQANKAFAHYRW
ncbi:MAG: 30S ribosomal protein S7 [Actinobacteria bacterium]|nr:MAG: 30S ribosomal protein S7 [Actinomycetota bacterium]